jgi:two-component system, OmpR family, KDP operon response regulator KdpE
MVTAVPKRILVVDDDADLRAAYVTLLSREDTAVHEAANGEQALAAALTLVPDLIVLDLNMPVMDGPEFLRRSRQIAPLAKVPIILVSGQVEEYRPKLEGLDYHAALPKPCPAEDLLNVVEQVLKLRSG